MRRRQTATGAQVRQHVIDHLTALVGYYGSLPGCPWPAQVQRLEARRDSVMLHGWEVADVVSVPPNSWWRLDPDDTLTAVSR